MFIMKIKPINTLYNGNYFRSRLEARWAYYFDLMGIAYQYESEGYTLSNGQLYLPDFYLPGSNGYVEVKPELNEFTKDDIIVSIKKGGQLMIDKSCNMLFLIGLPKDHVVICNYSELIEPLVGSTSDEMICNYLARWVLNSPQAKTKVEAGTTGYKNMKLACMKRFEHDYSITVKL